MEAQEIYTYIVLSGLTEACLHAKSQVPGQIICWQELINSPAKGLTFTGVEAGLRANPL